MLTLEQTKTFKKSLKKYRHRKTVLKELDTVIQHLVNSKPLPSKYRDHELKDQYKGIRELHLQPDDLLLYVKILGEKITLIALGSYSEIF